MVHPSELLRTNSLEARQFAAPINIINDNPIDCGCSNLPCFNKWFNLEKFAKLNTFVICLSIVGFLHGVLLYYFRTTAEIWAQHYNLSYDNIELLIYADEFFIGIFGLIVGYWGNRIHRISWIGGLTIFFSISSLLLLVPEIYRKNFRNETEISTSNNLCINTPPYQPPKDEEINYISVVLLLLFQIFYANASISFLTHGITYVDDNAPMKHSPACIGICLAVKELGKQIGIYIAGFRLYFGKTNVFASPIWICVSVGTFLDGCLITMFPKNLPSIMIQRVSASILDIASGYQVQTRKKEIQDGFISIFLRLIKNKILLLNIFCVVLMQSSIINLNIFGKIANQSRFSISSKYDTSLTQLTTNLLTQPLVAISMIATGTIISKVKPQIKSLLTYNIIISILLIIFFISTGFLKCNTNNQYKMIVSSSYCRAHCNYCMLTDFQPICVQNKTYFSPCFAGCSSIKEINSAKIYQNCTCGGGWYEKGNYEGTDGACNGDYCNLLRTLSEINNMICLSLLATIFITNIIIIMRCVLSKDKPLALGLYVTFLGIIPYVPVRLIYSAVVEQFCEFKRTGQCQYYSEKASIFISTITVILMLISIIFAIIVRCLINFNYDIEELTEDNNLHELEYIAATTTQRLINDENLPQSTNNITQNSNNSLSHDDSLLDLENVGDDHDSVGSIGSELNRRR